MIIRPALRDEARTIVELYKGARGGRPFAVIENVIVAAHARRNGVGRALMSHARDHARAKDCYKLMLATGADSTRNRAFCESCGFVGNKIGFQIRFEG